MLDDIRRGEVVGHRVHQLGDADFRLGGREQRRNQRAFDHGLSDRGPELVGGNLLAAEIGFHHLLVGFDDVLDQLRVGVGDVADVGRARIRREAVNHALAAVGGKVHRLARLAERLGNLAHQPGEVSIVGVDLVYHDRHGHVELAGGLVQTASVNLDAGRS